jgi:hypothetical protein
MASILVGLAVWLNQAYIPGSGWLLLTALVVMGGIITYLYRQRSVGCSLKPQVNGLQISCLAVQALGVQLLWLAELPELAPFWSGWAYLAILTGVAGLGWLSLFCSCRDEALQREFSSPKV